MKRYFRYSLVYLIVLSLFGCEKDNTGTDSKDIDTRIIKYSDVPPEIPEATDIDVDGDSKMDYKIDYWLYTLDGLNFTGDQISAGITPLNSNYILKHKNKSSLFLGINDKIYEADSDSIYWSDIHADVASVGANTLTDYKWPNVWSIISEYKSDTYFLAIKMTVGEKTAIGWIELFINEDNGVVKVVDKHLSYKDSINITD